MSDLAISDGFAESFDTVLHWLFLRFRLRGMAFLGTSATFRKANKTLERFLKYAIDKQLSSEKSDNPKSTQSMLSGLTEKTRDPNDLLTGLLFAGRDATGSLILLTLLLLSRHPEIYTKLRSLVLAIFPEPPGTPLNHTHLQFLPLPPPHHQRDAAPLLSTPPKLPYIYERHRHPPWRRGRRQVACRCAQRPADTAGYLRHASTERPLGRRCAGIQAGEVGRSEAECFAGGGVGVYTVFKGTEGVYWPYVFPSLPSIAVQLTIRVEQYALTEASYCLVRFVQRFDRLAPDPDDPGKGADITKAIAVAMAPAEAK